MMRRISGLPVALATVVAGSLINAGSGWASGGEELGCRVLPGPVNTFSPYCGNSQPASTYEVGFAVQGETASSTYSWSRPTRYAVVSGCSSSTNWCYLSVPGGSIDRSITVSVTLTQGAMSETLTSNATITAYCNGLPC